MKNIYASIFLLFLVAASSAQTFNGTGGTIITLTDTSRFNIPVSGLSPSTVDFTFGLEQVVINIAHTRDNEVDAFLAAPDGTMIMLTTDNGGTGDNYTNTVFRWDVATNITSGTAPFTGTFRPEGNLYSLNNGQNGNGTWQLRVIDDVSGTTGSVVSWSITFGSNPARNLAFLESNLPIVVINTNSQTIQDSPKIIVDMGIIDNGIGNRNHLSDPFNDYSGKIGIEIRGSSSQQFPKKGYAVDIMDAAGINQVDTPILGMPSHHSWVMSAEYSDKTLMHNFLSYQLGREMGHWASRGIYCDVVLNGQYIGVYVFRESIKRDNNRVDIANLHTYENTWPDISGGYIIKIDKTTAGSGAGWTSPYLPINHANGETIYYQYETPSDDSITPQQESYIQAYVDSFESALFGVNYMDSALGYKQYIGNGSFQDYFFADEISKNVDGYRISTYLYKDKEKTLKCGPFWDYDIAYGNANYCEGDDTTGWAYMFPCTGGNQIPQWWPRMLEQDSDFANQTKCRWMELRQNVLSIPHIYSIIDSVASLIDESQGWNFQQWPILGIYVWPNVPPYPTTYAGEITNLKKWLNTRIAWMDANMPGTCNCSLNLTSVENVSCNGACDGQVIAVATSPYPKTYTWDNGNLSDSLTFLCPGTYALTMEDAVGCKRIDSVTITEPVALTSTSSSTDASCFGCTDGTASVTPSGGTSPYSYSWSPAGGTNATATNLGAGNYTVTVTDANGCITTKTVTVDQPASVITLTFSHTDVTCYGDSDGAASVTPGGGASPYTFSWSNGATTATINNLAAGCYTVTVSDGNGDTAVDSVCIAQPPQFIVNAVTISNVTCTGSADGSVTSAISGGTGPYTFSWSPVGGAFDTLINLSAGCYTITVNDANACPGTSTACITEPPPIVVTVSQANVLCNGDCNGTATVIANGGTLPYSYNWCDSSTANTATGLCPGVCTVTVTDFNGCVTSPQTFVIAEPPAIALTISHTDATCAGCADGLATVNVTGGTPGYTYLWMPGSGQSSSFGNLLPGNYTVCVTDANGCTTCDSVTVLNDPLSVSNIFNNNTGIYVYPNPLSDKTDFVFGLSKKQQVVIGIYDVTGKLITEVLNGEQSAGQHVLRFDAAALGRGVYIYRFRSEMSVEEGKLIIQK